MSPFTHLVLLDNAPAPSGTSSPSRVVEPVGYATTVGKRVGMPAITETEALLGICAAVDRAVEADPASRQRVASVLGLDDAADVAGVGAGRRERHERLRTSLPSVDDALAALRDIPAVGDWATSRLLTLAALEAAEPARTQDDVRTELVAAALAGGDLAPPGVELELLGAVRRLPTRKDLVATCVGMCNVDFVGTFRNELTYPGRTLDDAKAVLNPENWRTCFGDWWCEMRLVDEAGGRPHYCETVACQVGFLTVEACLQFVQSEGPGEVLVLDYRKCGVEEHQPERSGVVVDEGWIVAERVADGVQFTTSKRVQFDDPISGESLVMAACGLGYGDQVRKLVDKCLSCKEAVKRWEPVEVSDA